MGGAEDWEEWWRWWEGGVDQVDLGGWVDSGKSLGTRHGFCHPEDLKM